MNTYSRNALIAIGLVIAAGAAVGAYLQFGSSSEEVVIENFGQVAGEMNYDAIPDGTPETAEVRFGETVNIMGTRIIPTEIVEDSRCPTDAECIQAGTVRVLATVVARGSDETMAEPYLFEIGVPLTVGDDQVTFVAVLPETTAGASIAPEDYIFTFTTVKGAGSEYYKG